MTSYGIKIKTEKKLLGSTLLQSHPPKGPFTRVISSRDEFHSGMTCISSWDDFHLGVWSFTFECLHDLEQKCVRPGMISSRSSAPG